MGKPTFPFAVGIRSWKHLGFTEPSDALYQAPAWAKRTSPKATWLEPCKSRLGKNIYTWWTWWTLAFENFMKFPANKGDWKHWVKWIWSNHQTLRLKVFVFHRLLPSLVPFKCRSSFPTGIPKSNVLKLNKQMANTNNDDITHLTCTWS